MAFYLAFKEIWRHLGRYFLISLVIALITTLVLFIAALAEGLGLGNREYIEKLNAELLLYQKEVEFSIPSSRLGLSRLNDVRRIEGVAEVGPLGFATGSVVRPGVELFNASLIGVEPGRPGEPPVFEGRQLQGKRSKEALIDRNLAQQTGLKVGDSVTIKTIQGTEEKLHTVPIVGISDSQRYSIQPSIIMPFLTWNDLKPRASADISRGEDLIANVMAVKLVDPTSREQLAQRIQQQVNGVEAASLKMAYENTPGYSAQQSTLSTQRTFTLLIGLLVIGGFFQIQTLQKVAQIGVLKAIGASNLAVAVATMTQIISVTIVGVIIGVLGTYGLSLGLANVTVISFTPSVAVTAIVTLLLIGPVGGLVSIRYLLRVEPLTALGLAS